jgi:purine-nucleoside phosphorylase
VDNIIRVGTTGSLDKSLVIGNILVGQKVFTDTNYCEIFKNGGESSFVCSRKLLNGIKVVAKENNIKVVCDSIFSTDTFYDDAEKNRHMISLGVKGVEMESASLYFNAIKSKKNALCLCTVSDEVLTNKKTTAKQRENDYDSMCVLALNLAVKLQNKI